MPTEFSSFGSGWGLSPFASAFGSGLWNSTA
jgi:hypothetical protein